LRLGQKPADLGTAGANPYPTTLIAQTTTPVARAFSANCAILSLDLPKLARVHNLLADCNKTFPAHSLIEHVVRSGRAPQDAISTTYEAKE
jgi:hypothetical protein